MSFEPINYQQLKVEESPIPGLFTIDLIVYGDSRGWFKENYQQQKLEALGLPHFNVVQNNFSFNAQTGVTRGLHAEPWEKFITLANGSVFAAWVDLRKGPTFGQSFSYELNPGRAVFVPRGVANGYQTLEDNITYTYLVNDHWSANLKYEAVDLFDNELHIEWPIPKDKAIVSEKDLNNKSLKDIKPMEF